MEPLFTPEQLAEIHAFHRPYYIRAAVGPFANLALMLLMLGVLVQPLHRLAVAAAAGLERRLGFLRTAPVSRAFFHAMDRLWGKPGWGAAVLFALFTDLFVSLVYLPVDVWFSYTLEHRHGMSTQTPATFAYDMVKAQLLAAFALSALVIGMFGLARKLRQWWLVLGVPVALLLLVSGALDPYRSRLFFNQKALPEGPLRTRIGTSWSRRTSPSPTSSWRRPPSPRADCKPTSPGRAPRAPSSSTTSSSRNSRRTKCWPRWHTKRAM